MQLIEEEQSKKALAIKEERDRKREAFAMPSAGNSSPFQSPRSPDNDRRGLQRSVTLNKLGTKESGDLDIRSSLLRKAQELDGSQQTEAFIDPIEHQGVVTHHVAIGPLLRQNRLSTVHLAWAHPGLSQQNASTQQNNGLWCLETFPITTRHYDLSSGKRKIEEVEWELEKLRGIREETLVNVLACALVLDDAHDVSPLSTRRPSTSKVSRRLLVLSERIEGPTLRTLLRQCGRLSWKKVRYHLWDMLCALDALHSRNLLHRNICLDYFYLDDGRPSHMKLAGTGYVRRLSDMDEVNPLSDRMGNQFDALPTSDLPTGWLAPESIMASEDLPSAKVYTRKIDIWNLGIVVLQMLYSSTIVSQYSSLDAFLASEAFGPLDEALEASAEHVKVFLRGMLEKSTRKRCSAEELKSRLEEMIRFEEAEENSRGITTETTATAEKRAKRDTFTAADKNDRPKMTRGPSAATDVGGAGAEEHELAMTRALRPGSFWQLRRNDATAPVTGLSRYESDFEELELLGKGAYGAVFKARNRLDGRSYAIKKIRLSASAENDDRTLREITALSRLNHQNIVRYVTCWIQTQAEDPQPTSSEEAMSSLKTTDGRSKADFSFRVPGIDDDFLSVGHDAGSNVRFGSSDSGESDDEDPAPPCKAGERPSCSEESKDSDSDSDSSSDSSSEARSGSESVDRIASRSSFKRPQPRDSRTAASPSQPRWLYIQMEYVENQTLREAIDRGLSVDESWRLFRQIIEALVHITSLGIIHRDLKPSNILMYCNDQILMEAANTANPISSSTNTAGDIKIGDFGLATTTPQQAQLDGPTYGTLEESGDLTTEVGTNLYIAPEVAKRGGSRYDHKVDVYAAGVIFFEMLAAQRVYKTGMERIGVVRDLRSEEVIFPKGWNEAQMPAQTKVIQWLLNHDPSRRPTALELLKSELLPPKLEDEYIAECLRLMSTPNSTYNLQLMGSLFGREEPADQREARDFTFDAGGNDEGQDNRFIGVACTHLRSLFRRHGAVELEAPLLLPPNELYGPDRKPVELLDKTGKVVQLPYDLVVPFARMAARSEGKRFKRYAIAPVFRDNLLAGGQPRSVTEVDFDIVSPEKTPAAEAEALSVVDEILDEMPGLDSEEWVVQISHGDVLDLIMDRVPPRQRPEALAAISLLSGGGKTAVANGRAMLNQLALPRSIVEEIEASNMSDDVSIVFSRLERLVALDLRPKLSRAVEEIKRVIHLAAHFGMQRRFLFTPLLVPSNELLYKGAIHFVVARAGSKKRDVLASGGRYDVLMKRFASPTIPGPPPHAVGIQIAVGRIALALAKHHESVLPRLMMSKAVDEERYFGPCAPRRCDVYVASGKGILSVRMEICRDLWAAGLSADLAYDHALEDSPALLASTCRAEGILFLVIARTRQSSLVKVKGILSRTEYEVPRHELCAWLAERIARQNSSSAAALTSADHHHAAGTLGSGAGAAGTAAAGHHRPTYDAAEAQVILPNPFTNASSRRQDKHGNNERRSKKNVAPIQERAVREVAKVVDDITTNRTMPTPTYAVELTGTTFARLCAASLARTDEQLWKLFFDSLTSVDERDYGRLVRKHIDDLEGGRCWLVSIREEGAYLV